MIVEVYAVLSGLPALPSLSRFRHQRMADQPAPASGRCQRLGCRPV